MAVLGAEDSSPKLLAAARAFLRWLHIVPAEHVLQKGECLILHLRELVGLAHVEEEMQR